MHAHRCTVIEVTGINTCGVARPLPLTTPHETLDGSPSRTVEIELGELELLELGLVD